jgi:orotidine-5'-phosphate decarboxylase
MMSVRTLIASALLILAAAAPALAADQPNVREACKQDVEQLCPGVQPGGGGIMQCLRDHADKVSDGCKQAARAAKQEAAKVREACKQDVEQLCPGVQPGGRRIRQCLRDHADKVSDGCKQAFQAARAAKQGQ